MRRPRDGWLVVGRLGASPVVSAVALSALAAMPPVVLLMGAARREGDASYASAAVLVAVLHMAAGAAGGVVFGARRSWFAALTAALVVAIVGSRFLLAGFDPGGLELGAERFFTTAQVLVAAVLSIAIVARVARVAPTSRGARHLSVGAVIGLVALVGVIAATLLQRTWIVPIPDDPLSLERVLPLMAEEARRRPATASVQRQYGIALLRAGRLDEAASILDGATLLDRHDPDAWSALGEAQLRLHYYTRAVSSLRTAVTLDSMRAGTWRALAGALSAVRHPMPHPRAELAYRQAIRLDPDDADARYEYARLLDVSRRDVEAMEQLDRALALDPMRTDFHLTACMMHKRKVRLAEALRHCERARGLEPGDAEIWAELATTRYVAGDLVGADSAFATAARLRPGFYDRRPELRDLWSATREDRDRPFARSGADVP